MVKKTGDVIPDQLSVRRQNNDRSSTIFTIHFPNLISTNPSSVGVTVTVNLETLKKLDKLIGSMLSGSCPKCGREVSFTRPRELDNGYYYCKYCGWSEE